MNFNQRRDIMKIETKYSIGDEISFNATISDGKYITCPLCQGKQSIIVEGVELECTNCEDGSYYLWKNRKDIITGLIKAIDIYIRGDKDLSYRYWIKDHNWISDEDIIEK